MQPQITKVQKYFYIAIAVCPEGDTKARQRAHMLAEQRMTAFHDWLNGKQNVVITHRKIWNSWVLAVMLCLGFLLGLVLCTFAYHG